jgi:hypothetical protein
MDEIVSLKHIAFETPNVTENIKPKRCDKILVL